MSNLKISAAITILIGIILGYLAGRIEPSTIVDLLNSYFETVIISLAIIFVPILVFWFFHEEIIRSILGLPKETTEQITTRAQRVAIDYLATDRNPNSTDVTALIGAVTLVVAGIRARIWLFRSLTVLIVSASGLLTSYIYLQQNEIIASQRELQEVQLFQAEATVRVTTLAEAQKLVKRLVEDSSDSRKIPAQDTCDNKERPIYHSTATICYPIERPLPVSMVRDIRLANEKWKPYTIVEPAPPSSTNVSYPKLGLTRFFLSPERGVMVKGLAESGFTFPESPESYIDFQNADLRNWIYHNTSADTQVSCNEPADRNLFDVGELLLRNSDLSGAYINGAEINLSDVILNGTNVENTVVILVDGNLKNTGSRSSFENTIFQVASETSMRGLDIQTQNPHCMFDVVAPGGGGADITHAEALAALALDLTDTVIEIHTNEIPEWVENWQSLSQAELTKKLALDLFDIGAAKVTSERAIELKLLPESDGKKGLRVSF